MTLPEQPIAPAPQHRPAIGWSIHALTASGVVVGLLGLIAVLDNHPKAALLWLVAALVIDGVDGPMARGCDIKRCVPKLDGYILDVVVDYVTCVVVPVAFIHHFRLLPPSLSITLIAIVLFVSALWMSRTDMETDDNWFNGFPAEWNFVVPSLYLLGTSTWVNSVVVLFFCALTMTNIKFVHPVRVRVNRTVTLSVTVLWLATMTGLTIGYPDSNVWGRLILVAGPAYYLWLSVRRTFDEGFRVPEQPAVASESGGA
ncbi:MAG: CDP-alcohol phosphatidyltransferase family protein [Acidimicrobiales bacterium]